jgi:Uma2 family endonuclease
MATTTLMSFAEFEHLDVGADNIELLNGELIRVPPADCDHNEGAEELASEIRLAMRSLGGFSGIKAHHEMGYLMTRDPHTWLQPDASVTHPNQPKERNPDPEAVVAKYYVGAPLIAIEMISGSERPRRLLAKVESYLDHGSAEGWTLYRVERRALVYRKGSAPRVETESFHTDLLPGVKIPFEKFFL